MKKTPPAAWILAVVCILVAAVPVIFLLPTSLLWSAMGIPASVQGLLTPDGTPSFFDGQYHQLTLCSLSLLVDLVAYFAFGCLIAMIFNFLTVRWQIIGWISTIVSGFGSAVLRWSWIGPKTDHDFVCMIVRGPIIIGFLGLAALIITALRIRKLNISHALPR